MKILGYVYRVVSNFAFLALVYYSLNFMEKYHHRAIVAILVLVYASMRAVLGAAFVLLLPEDRAARARSAPPHRDGRGGRCSRLAQASRQRGAALRRDGEMKSYIDLFFLAMVVLLCIAKIVTN